MDTKTKIFWWVMGILIFLSFGLTFYRYMIKKDYLVQSQVDCDPYLETCFTWQCDPESTVEGEMCTNDPEADVWYYKIIVKNASRVELCDANDENCQALACEKDEPDCEFVFCNEENKVEFGSETCTNPIEYSLANPVEEEECVEGDEECVSIEEEDVAAEGVEEAEEPAIQTTEDALSAKESEVVEEPVFEGGLPIDE